MLADDRVRREEVVHEVVVGRINADVGESVLWWGVTDGPSNGVGDGCEDEEVVLFAGVLA